MWKLHPNIYRDKVREKKKKSQWYCNSIKSRKGGDVNLIIKKYCPISHTWLRAELLNVLLIPVITIFNLSSSWPKGVIKLHLTYLAVTMWADRFLVWVNRKRISCDNQKRNNNENGASN